MSNRGEIAAQCLIDKMDAQRREVVLDDVLQKANDQMLLDVRSRSELAESGKIPGSVNVPLDTLEAIYHDRQSLEKAIGRPLGQHGENLILSCQSGRRASIAQQLLDSVGLTRTKIYKGSFLDWTTKGQLVEKVSPMSEQQQQ